MVMDKMLSLEEELSSKREWMKERVDKGESEVANFYEGSVVFVTGGSGFLGKQLIEKLIRSCKIAKVYMLLRPKKGKTIQERLQKILREPVFDSLRKGQPKFGDGNSDDKIVPIEGDVADLGIGISEKDWTVITKEVNYIFHAASTTHFELPLKLATLINVRGTREVLSLAKACKQLRCMVYISTAYSQATNSRLSTGVLEQFYDCPVPVDAMIRFAETVDQGTLDGIMEIFKKEWPNSYTFTKCMAEEIIRSMSGDLPICVVRPAVVLASSHEPGPGWLDENAIFSISGLFLGAGLGLIHVFHFDQNVATDFIPVDYVNNATIVAARHTAKRYEAGEKEIKIYTISSNRNPSDKNVMQSLSQNELTDLIPTAAVYYYFIFNTQSKWMFTFLTWLIHYTPAMMVDLVLAVTGNKLRLLRIYRKAYKMSFAFDHFEKNEWKLYDHNTHDMFNSLSEVDKNIFHFDMASIEWREYFTKWFYGLRRYMIREDLKNAASAKRKQFWLRILHYVLCSLYFYIICKVLQMFVWILSVIF